jgi:hypothetical protein
MDNPLAAASTAGRILTPVVLFGKSVRLFLWPHPLSHDYSYNAIPICTTPLDPRFVWGMLCIATMGVGAIWSYRRRGRVLWCVVFWVLSYSLVSNTFILSGTIFAERLLYMPSVAFCWLVALSAVAAARGVSHAVKSDWGGWLIVAPMFAILCTAHVVLAVRRGEVWRSERSLIAHALSVVGDSGRVHMQAGFYAIEDKDYPEAIAQYKRVIEIMPDHMPAHFELGRAYLLSGEPALAVPQLLKCFNHLPTEANYAAAVDLGRAYRALGNREEATRWFHRAKLLKMDAVPATDG